MDSVPKSAPKAVLGWSFGGSGSKEFRLMIECYIKSPNEWTGISSDRSDENNLYSARDDPKTTQWIRGVQSMALH